MSNLTPAQLLESGAFEQNQGRFKKAYEFYLDAVVAAADVLKQRPEESDKFTIAEQGFARAKAVLAQWNQVPAKPINLIQTKALVIPSSPWQTALKDYIIKQAEAEALYKAALDANAAPDLKGVRHHLEVIEVAKLEIQRLTKLVNSTAQMHIDNWSPGVLATHIAYLSRNLFVQVNPNLDVIIPSLDRVSPALFRFFAFQEYLFEVFRNAILNAEDGRQQLTCEHAINIAHALFYVEHDLASTTTILSVMTTMVDLVKSCAKDQKSILNKLLTLFDTNSVQVHEELLSDMVKAHPVNSYDDVIVPCLQVFVQAATKIYENVPISDKEKDLVQTYITTLSNCQHRLPGTSAKVTSPEVLHWVLSQHYDAVHAGDFWGTVLKAFPEPAADEIPEDVEPPVEAVEPNTNEESDEEDPFDDDILKRLEALQKPKSTF